MTQAEKKAAMEIVRCGRRVLDLRRELKQAEAELEQAVRGVLAEPPTPVQAGA